MRFAPVLTDPDRDFDRHIELAGFFHRFLYDRPGFIDPGWAC
jgi:hypothetical protein